MNESIPFIVAGELLAAVARQGRLRSDSLGEAAIEALHHAIGLRMPRANEAA